MQPRSELQTFVREALPADAERITALAAQLGYDVALADVKRRLAAAEEGREILVAVVPRAGVIGWIEVSQCEALLSPRAAEVEGLVVEDEYRGNGIGELLLRNAESWARRRGSSVMRVRSNVLRERAHAFYLRLGFTRIKVQQVFERPL